MGVDNNTLLTEIAQEAVDSLRNKVRFFSDLICENRSSDSVNGSIPYLAAKDTLGKDLGAKAIGSDPTPIDMDLSSVAFEMQRYSHSLSLDRSVARDLDQYTSVVGEITETLMEYCAIASDSDLAALMTAAGSNGQQAAANGAWSAAGSTPVLDMQEAKRLLAPRADMAVLGITSAFELARHPDIKEATSNYAGSGAVGFDTLRGIVGNLLGISPENVHIWEQFYNSAKFGQSATLAYVTGDFFWVGEKRALLKVKQNEADGVATVETNHLKTEYAVSYTHDFVRVNSFDGAEVTGL